MEEHMLELLNDTDFDLISGGGGKGHGNPHVSPSPSPTPSPVAPPTINNTGAEFNTNVNNGGIQGGVTFT
jgi:hypothetical protein